MRPVTRPTPAPIGDGEQHRRDQAEAAQQRAEDNGAERHDPADGQVKTAADDEIGLPDGHDPEQGGAVEDGLHVGRGEEVVQLDGEEDQDDRVAEPDAERLDQHLAPARHDPSGLSRRWCGRWRLGGHRRGGVPNRIHYLTSNCWPAALRAFASVLSAPDSASTSRPAWNTRSRSLRLTASFRSEVAKTIVVPVAATSASSAWISLRAPTSTPRVGSSMIKIGVCM